MASRETHEFYNNILEIYASMLKLYDRQAKLEIEGKKDSSEYKQNYQLLYMIREHVYEKYEKSHIPVKEADDYVSFLNTTFNEFLGEEGTFLSMLSDEQVTTPSFRLYNDFYYRSLNKHIVIVEGDDEDDVLEQMVLDNIEFEELKKQFGYISNDGTGYVAHEPEEDEEDYEEYEELENQTNQIYMDAYEQTMQMEYKSMDVDLFRIQYHELTLLDYLEDYIANTKNKRLRSELIKVKYRLIFTFPSVENRYLRVPETINSTYVLKTAIRNYYKSNDIDLKTIFDVEYTHPVEEMINFELNTLSNMDMESRKYKDKVKAIMHMLNLKANISINIDDVIDDNLHDLKREAISNATNEKTKKLIKESFKTKKELMVTKMLT